jgi:hypothetical protein
MDAEFLLPQQGPGVDIDAEQRAGVQGDVQDRPVDLDGGDQVLDRQTPPDFAGRRSTADDLRSTAYNRPVDLDRRAGRGLVEQRWFHQIVVDGDDLARPPQEVQRAGLPDGEGVGGAEPAQRHLPDLGAVGGEHPGRQAVPVRWLAQREHAVGAGGDHPGVDGIERLAVAQRVTGDLAVLGGDQRGLLIRRHDELPAAGVRDGPVPFAAGQP